MPLMGVALVISLATRAFSNPGFLAWERLPTVGSDFNPHAPNGSYEDVTCSIVEVDGLDAPMASTYTCRPEAPNVRFPLLVFGHGDLAMPGIYTGLLRQLASFGYVVSAYRSCLFSLSGVPSQCDSGRTSFLETLKVIKYYLHNPSADGSAAIDMTKQVTVAGHSTGARAALMLAAVKDTPSYLRGTEAGRALDKDPELRRAASLIGAAVAFNPDLMSDAANNPDVAGFNVTKTPVLIITSTVDHIEPTLSAWTDFTMLQTPTKAYVDLRGLPVIDGHLSPIFFHPVGPYAALWGMAFAHGSTTASNLIFGDGPSSMRNVLDFANVTDRNTGPHGIGLLLCYEGRNSWPAKFASFC